MREILFRGKAINRDKGFHTTNYKNGDWVYGLVTQLYDERFENLPAKMTNTDGIRNIEVDYKTISQYTGLTDKNGKKVFEGDIVKHHFGKEKGIVKFGEYRQPFNDDIHTKHIGFYVDWISGERKKLLRKDLGYWVNLDKNYNYEIFIGNIHDNPELLKEADNE